METKILTSRTMKGGSEWSERTTSIFEYYPLYDRIGSLSGVYKKLIDALNRSEIGVGLRLYANNEHFDVIISKNYRVALIVSVLSMLRRRPTCFHVLSELLLYPQQQNYTSKLKHRVIVSLIHLLLGDIGFIRVNSFAEIDYYSSLLGMGRDRFKFVPIPTSVLKPEFVSGNGGYIFAGGKNFRDYATLVKAVDGTGLRLILVGDRKSIKGIKMPQNVEVYESIPYEAYLGLLRSSRIVVVPLSNVTSSCGQIAFLEAMSLGKPVIVTRGASSSGYIVDGKSGLLYDRGDDQDLRSKLLLLHENEELRASLAKQAFDDVVNKYNYDSFVSGYLDVIYSSVAHGQGQDLPLVRHVRDADS